MYISRLLEKSLKEALRTFPAVLITGPRQSGKTTLVRQVLGKKYDYVSLDQIDDKSLAIEDPKTFLQQYSSPVIIDEIQNAPELFSYIKSLIDQDRKPGQWILTGSQQFPLMKNVSDSLAGRVAVLTLHPFALDEVTQSLRPKLNEASRFIHSMMAAKSSDYQNVSVGDWLLFGGYPEVVLNRKVSKRIWFSSYLTTYIDRDVRGNIKTANLNDFERFVKLLAVRTAQELNYSTFSRDIGVSVPTIKSWVSFLEASSLIYLLYPYYKNFGKRVIKSPKCYFMDTGLVAFLAGLQDKEHLLKGPMAGALFETACITHFVKRFTALMDPCGLYFYRSVSGHEVDLLVETANGIYPIEIKLSSTITSKHASGLDAWFKLSQSKQTKGLIVSTSQKGGLVKENISHCHFSAL